MSAEFSHNHQFVATADDDGSACIWSVRTHQPLRLIPEPSGASGGVSNSTAGAAPVNWAVFDGTGNLLLTASNDGTARIWNWRDGTQLKTLTEPTGAAVHDAFFSPNGKLVVTATDFGIGIWSVDSAEEIQRLSVPDRAQVFNAAFSPDGRRLVACGAGTSIFDVHNGLRLADLPYGSTVSDCGFSPGGHYVVTAGQSGATRIFSTQMADSLSQLETIARARVTTSLTAAQRRQYGVP
jgi:WD40 repeat protein